MADVSPTPECPCGAQLSDADRSTINWGRDNPVFQNPVASQISNAQGGFAQGLLKAQRVSGILNSLNGNTTEIDSLLQSIGNAQGALTNYENTSNRLSGLPFTGDGPDLLSLVSTVGAAVNFQCALGIDGLDVGVGIGLMNENGKLKLNTAINVQANLNKILDKIGLSDTSTFQEAKDAMDGLLAEVVKITNEINAVAGEINTAIDQVNGLFNDALDFVTQFTNINFAMNFSNDPCTKFGVGFQQGILNPEFIERARRSNPLNTSPDPGFGTITR